MYKFYSQKPCVTLMRELGQAASIASCIFRQGPVSLSTMQRWGKLFWLSFSTNLQTNSFKFQIIIKLIIQAYQISQDNNKSHQKTSEMSTSNGQEGYEETLMYDTTAFLHYLNSILSIIAIILLVLILQDIKKKVKSQQIRAMEKDQVYKVKVRNSWVLQAKQRGRHMKSRFCGLVVCLLCISVCVWATSNNGQLTTFDPYQILNVDSGATNAQIKKAYRKLALQMHPDRKKDDSTSAKFILISKAYKCLTDAKTRENCIKFGNPDGQIYKKFGIGLPSFILKSRYENYVAFSLLIILLVVIPCVFFKWTSKLQEKKSLSEHLIESNEVAYLLMSPKINMVDYCVILGCMKEIQVVFSDHKVLSASQLNQFVQILLQQSNLSQQHLRTISPQKLYRCQKIYRFMINRDNSIELSRIIPRLCRQIIKYASIFGKRSLQGFLLSKTSDLTVNWYGLAPCKQAIHFNRIMMSKSAGSFVAQLLAQQQLTVGQLEIIKNHKDQNLYELISSNGANQLIGKFSDRCQTKVIKYLNCLPLLQVSTKIKCGKCQVSQAKTDDVICIDVSVLKKNKTFGQVVNENFPVLAEEEFVLLISNNSNLLSIYFFQFSQSSRANHTFELKKLPVGLFRINVAIYSLSYLNYDIIEVRTLQVFERPKKKPVIFNEEDLKVEKMRKNFFESLIDLKINHQSDFQLSESQQDEKQAEKVSKKPKSRLKKRGSDAQRKDLE